MGYQGSKLGKQMILLKEIIINKINVTTVIIIVTYVTIA